MRVARHHRRSAGPREGLVVKLSPQPWHSWSSEQVCQFWETSPAGLPYVVARQRLRRWGRFPPPRRPHPLQVFWQPWRNPLTYVLLGMAAALQVLTPASGDGLWLGAIALWHGGLGMVANGQITRLLGKVKGLVATAAVTVRRDGEDLVLPVRDLVPGDVMALVPDLVCPVDVRLLASEGLQVNETAIGGEGWVAKTADSMVSEDTPPLARPNMVYAGTTVVAGTGWGVVVAGGRLTYGQSRRQQERPTSQAHFELLRFRQGVVVLASVVVLAIAAFGFREQRPLPVATALALALAVYPQNLLRWATLAQVQASKRLSLLGIEVRHPAAIDTLGRLTTVTAILTSDTDLDLGGLVPLGIQRHGLLRASEGDANAFGQVVGFPVNSALGETTERLRLWQSYGQVVAVVGATVEDVPLMKAADLAIADRTCPRLVQEAAAVILPKGDGTYLAEGIVAGRQVRANLRQSLLVQGSVALALLILAIAATFAKVELVPSHWVWIGSVTAPLLSLTQVFARQTGAPPLVPLLGRRLLLAIGMASLALAGPAIAVFLWTQPYRSLVEARTLATAVVMVGTLALALAEPHRSIWARPARLGVGALTLAGFVAQTYGGDAFGAVPLSLRSWAVALLAGSCPFWLREANSNAAVTETVANSGEHPANWPMA
ncbi:MAG: P-type ATPase [Pseudanabaenaceae cyanobacterium]